MVLNLSFNSGYTVPAGTSLQLLVSPGSFPTSWPSPAKTTLTLKSGTVALPSVGIDQVNPEEIFAETQPRLGPCKQVDVLRQPVFQRNLTYGLSDNVRCITTR